VGSVGAQRRRRLSGRSSCYVSQHMTPGRLPATAADHLRAPLGFVAPSPQPTARRGHDQQHADAAIHRIVAEVAGPGRRRRAPRQVNRAPLRRNPRGLRYLLALAIDSPGSDRQHAGAATDGIVAAGQARTRRPRTPWRRRGRAAVLREAWLPGARADRLRSSRPASADAASDGIVGQSTGPGGGDAHRAQ
jgi:hypothetical protein